MKFKLFPSRQEAKSNYPTSDCSPVFRNQSLISYLLGKNEIKLAAYEAVRYYDLCAPLYDAVDRICYAFSIIDPIVYDEKEKEFIPDHPVIDLLKHPNMNNSSSDFMYALLAFLILTGNSYMIGSGINQNSPPSQLFIRPPQQVSPQIDSLDFAISYNVNIGAISKKYDRAIDPDEGFIYTNENNGIFSQLFPFKTFNPMSSGYNFIGSSILNPIYYEIEQYISSGKHNLSLLKRGTTVSGIFSTVEGNMDQDQFDRLRAQINEYFSGDENAGRPFLVDNLTFTPSQQSNKDMDFMELKKSVEQTIYKNLRIPLPLVSPDTMIMANLTTSATLFYDNGVIPWIERVYDSLTRFLMPKYDNSENLKIWFDIKNIPALESRRVDNIKALKDVDVFTNNEIRADLGATPLIGGGERWQAAGLLPYERDPEDDSGTIDDDDEDESQDQDQDQDQNQNQNGDENENGDD